MPSLGIEKGLTPQFVGLVDCHAGDMFPGIVVSQKHAVVLAGPPLATVGPVHSGKMQDLPEGHHLLGLDYK